MTDQWDDKAREIAREILYEDRPHLTSPHCCAVIAAALRQAAAQAWRPMSEADETEDVEIIAFNLRHKTVSRYRWQEKSIRAGQHLLEVEVGWSEIRGCTIIRREYQDDYVWVPVPSPLPPPPEPQG